MEDVAAFARKQGLSYLLAIDPPATEEGFVGATSPAYGVRGIPSAAGIDRDGRVAFEGRFKDPLRKAEERLHSERGTGSPDQR